MTRADGTKGTVQNYTRDVAAFLMADAELARGAPSTGLKGDETITSSPAYSI